MASYDTFDPKIYYSPSEDPKPSEEPKSDNPQPSKRPKTPRRPKKEPRANSRPKSNDASLKERIKACYHNSTLRLVIGIFLGCFGAYLAASFISYLVTCASDQSAIRSVEVGAAVNVANAGGEAGARLSDFLIDGCFGLGAGVIVFWTIAMSLKLLTHRPRFKTVNFTIKCIIALITISLVVGLLTIAFDNPVNWGGYHGRYVNEFVKNFLGWSGAVILCIFMIALFVVICLRDMVNWIIRKKKKYDLKRAERAAEKAAKEEKERIIRGLEEVEREDAIKAGDMLSNEPDNMSTENLEAVNFASAQVEPSADTTIEKPAPDFDEVYYSPADDNLQAPQPEEDEKVTSLVGDISGDPESDDNAMVVNVVKTVESKVSRPVAVGSSAPGRLPYKFPPFDILRQGDSKISVDQSEQQENKDRIERTLLDFGIAITNIQATVGPTVTLYEIVPEKGMKIRRIRELGDDIALRLAATGVRIIAPIPGRGTIGIEVANKDPQTVSMRPVLKSQKFQESKAELPIGLGATISSGFYVADLAKMPHLLVAGATGQGKSVGLNAIIASLLYSKTPDQLKLVMIDPKMVEFSLYEKIEQHYLAKIPDAEESIITDMNNVVATLSSLCIEMDDRYKLLKAAHVRKVTEYNDKVRSGELSELDGHRFMPYIVVIVDEFSDLIMTAGKEVEMPIARLAQKARAVGIHVILATQRPSTNVITGVIKANFPARIAFKVSSGVDSKTILDTTGAQQLIGRGDMLISNSSEMVRVQCAFIDTPEVEQMCDYISKQPYPTGPYILPEPKVGSDSEGMAETEFGGERDSLLEEVARAVVMSQTASTSSVQRRYGIGYNRAGRIMDQLEAMGVVGPATGGKPRNVLVDAVTLESILSSR